LHTVGGDDTNTTAADLAAYLGKNGYKLTVVGLPKTVDNDVYPIRQSLGAWTAAEQGAIYFENVVNEHSANPRMLIVHEVMGRNCGWLTAYTAKVYRDRVHGPDFLPSFNLARMHKDVDAVYVPEMEFDIEAEAKRLGAVMDEQDCVNVFVSEGACLDQIVLEMEAKGEAILQARQRERRAVVREAVCQAARCREGARTKVRLLRALGRCQRRRLAADSEHGRPRRRVRSAR
jgi:pyrophosphate--fructose-6-phosphate 1-phosphotransferase